MNDKYFFRIIVICYIFVLFTFAFNNNSNNITGNVILSPTDYTGFDLNQDGCSNELDLSLFAKDCIENRNICSNLDYNNDGTINMLDYSILSNYTKNPFGNTSDACHGRVCASEICDGLDNDCDMIIDNNLLEDCRFDAKEDYQAKCINYDDNIGTVFGYYDNKLQNKTNYCDNSTSLVEFSCKSNGEILETKVDCDLECNNDKCIKYENIRDDLYSKEEEGNYCDGNILKKITCADDRDNSLRKNVACWEEVTECMYCYNEECQNIRCEYNPSHEACICTDNDGDGFSQEGGHCGPIDCDDKDRNVYPSNGCDGNCNYEKDGFCDKTCIINDPDCSPICGNNILEYGESCDGGNLCTRECKQKIIVPKRTDAGWTKPVLKKKIESNHIEYKIPAFKQYFGGGYNSDIFCKTYETDFDIKDIVWDDNFSISRQFEEHGWHFGGILTVTKNLGNNRSYSVCLKNVPLDSDGYSWESFYVEMLIQNNTIQKERLKINLIISRAKELDPSFSSSDLAYLPNEKISSTIRGDFDGDKKMTINDIQILYATVELGSGANLDNVLSRAQELSPTVNTINRLPLIEYDDFDGDSRLTQSDVVVMYAYAELN